MKTKNIATFFAIFAAALYAINIPLSKLLLQQVQPTMMAAFLYLGAGVGLFALGVATKEKGEKFPEIGWIPVVMLLGFVAYGLSINFYIKAQKDLGAAKTSAYYSAAPFLGVLFGVMIGTARNAGTLLRQPLIPAQWITPPGRLPMVLSAIR